MPSSQIYDAFRHSNCVRLFAHSHVKLGASLLKRVRDCLASRRRNLTYSFAAVYPGEGKERIGLSVALRRAKGSTFIVDMRWFRTSLGPPAEFGHFADLVHCLGQQFGTRKLWAVALFSFDQQRVQSVFRPIQILDFPVLEFPGIFDEIIGLTGVKRDPQGKVAYELEVSIREARLFHEARFTQTGTLSEDLALSLLETASRISALALKPKEGA